MPAPPRLIFVNRFFHPDHSATSQILSDLAFHLAAHGWQVSVIASRLRYDAPGALLPKSERISGVEICRVATTRFGRHWLPGRAIDYLTFYLTAGWALLRLAGPEAIVVVKTDPPLFSTLAVPIARLRGALAVNWLQDLYPEIAERLGVRLLAGAAGGMLRWLRNRSLRASCVNVAIGDDMARRVKQEGVPAQRLRVLPNWVDDGQIRPVPPAENPLRAVWGLEGKFVVAYSGNLGRAHDVETVLSAAEALADRADIVFLFIGGGHEMAALEARFRALGARALFRPYQAREQLSQSLSVGDVHWLSLKTGLDGLILPSKFYGILAAGRPVLAIGSVGFELGRLVEETGCGCHIPLGDGARLAAAISELAGDPARRAQMGARARGLLEERFSRAGTLRAWEALFAAIAEGRLLRPDSD